MRQPGPFSLGKPGAVHGAGGRNQNPEADREMGTGPAQCMVVFPGLDDIQSLGNPGSF